MQREISMDYEQRNMEELDVVVIGAGLSGLVAAYRLRQSRPSLRIKIFEAKERFGGRIYSIELPATNNSTDIWDLGGTWIGRSSTQPRINKLIKELNIGIYPQKFSGKKMIQVGNKHTIAHYSSTIPDIGIISLLDTSNFIKSVDRTRKSLFEKGLPPQSVVQDLDSITADTLYKKKIWTKCTEDCNKCFHRATFGTETNKMSAYYVMKYANSCGGFINMMESDESSAQGYKVKGGMLNVCDKLLHAIGKENIIYESPVHSIQQIFNELNESFLLVDVVGGQKYSTKFVVLALPPHLVPGIQISPPLSANKYEYFSSVSPGHLIKVILTYERSFWRDSGFSGEIVTNGGLSYTEGCQTGPLSVVFDGTTHNGSPALVGLIGGEQALQYESKTKEERKEAVLKSLDTFFGDDNARNFIVYCEKIWRHESFVGGCPVSIAPPGIGRYMDKSLSQPENQIHFAGSELAENWSGFMEGAVESGERAANEILKYQI